MMRLPSLTPLDEDSAKMDQPTSSVMDLLTGYVDALRTELARLSDQLGLYMREEKSVMARILARQATSAKLSWMTNSQKHAPGPQATLTQQRATLRI
jgi:hypothetical protein